MFDSGRAFFYLKIFPRIAAHYEKMSSGILRRAKSAVAAPANPEQSPRATIFFLAGYNGTLCAAVQLKAQSDGAKRFWQMLNRRIYLLLLRL
jgi:hypothetical protein